GAEPVVPHRTVRIADHALGVAAAIERAERAITERVVQPAEHAPVGSQLHLEAVTEQPRGPFGMCRVELFRDVPAILDPARELRLIAAISQFDSSRLAIGRGAGQRIAQFADLRAAAEIPALFRHEVDSRCACEAGLSAVLVALLEVDAGAVGEPSFHARYQVT